MVAPDAAIDGGAAIGRGVWGTDEGGGLDAVSTVEPAVGAPAEAIGEIVADGAGVEAIEEDDGRGVRLIVVIFVGEKE